MELRFRTISAPQRHRTACLVLPVWEDGALPDVSAGIDRSGKGQIRRLIKSEQFTGKPGKSLLLHAPAGVNARRVLLLGCGKDSGSDAAGFRKAISHALSVLQATSAEDATLCLDGITTVDRDQQWQLEQIALLAGMADYRYTRTLSKPDPAPRLGKLTVASAGRGTATHSRSLQRGSAMANGANLARELGNLPANICTPAHLASAARELAARHASLDCKVLDEPRMKRLGMGALLSVTSGTREPAKLIVLEYRGAARGARPYVLVGKGITFDSGGISLKPGANMDEMKFDMCGAASVIGTLSAIAELGAKINVVGIVAACENLPSGSATKPGDVVRSMSGISIEVLNTDAEGRLILCDALSYAARYKPAAMVDIATLTGACVVALGKHASGLFSNSPELATELLGAGEQTHDRAWHMPLWEDYQEQLKSNFADVANVGGPGAGSITAACFLSRFVKEQRWAHLDIAGTAWESGTSKGATGRPVPLLTRYLLDRADTAK